MKNLLKYGTMVMAVVFVLISCDTDPNELGGEFLGIDIDGTIVEQDFEAKAFSAPLNAVQTNRFPSVQLGTYSDPIYGQSAYEFVSQLSLSRVGIDFSQNAEFKSVVLSIPYFSRLQGVVDEKTTYVLDSVYGNEGINLQIYRSNYFLNSFDINNVDQAAAYYSDLGDLVDANKGDAIEFLIGDPGTQTTATTLENFTPSPLEIQILETVEGAETVQERLSPRLRLNLATDFWKNLLVGVDGILKFSSDSDFQNAFRGLYFKVSGTTGNGNLSHLNLNGANITINYVSRFIDVNDADGDGDTTEEIVIDSSFEINITGNRVVFVDHEFPGTIQTAITNSFNPETGSERLYLKGGPGAISFIDLFGVDNDNDGEAEGLTELRAKNALINEANLEFYVDQSAFPEGTDASVEPESVLLYDVVRGITIGFGVLERDSTTKKGVKYKIRITQHITDILSGAIDNNRLGLYVTQNASLPGNSKVKNQVQPVVIESVPTGSAISHEGTVLYGNLSRNDDDPSKRLKLKIFFTETN
jgi:hypothetical protein